MKYFYPTEYKALLRLGVPIMIGQLGLTLQNLADNIMVGQHSTEELAAAGFINSMFLLTLLLTIGYGNGAVPMIGALYSRGDSRRIVAILKSSFVTDTLQGLIMVAALVALYFLLPYMGQPDELLPLMRPYLVIQIVSLPFMVLTGALKQFTDSINDTSVAMIVTIIGNVWNIFFNWVLIFGHLGFPELGIIGAAWATLSSRIVMLLVFALIVVLLPKYKIYRAHWREVKANKNDMRTLNRLGWPIAIQMGVESASFSLVSILIGWLGTDALAAHQVMINVANAIFMTYIGVSTAVSIRVSNYNGLKNMRGARHAAFAGYEMILLLGIVMSTLAYLLHDEMSHLFTDSEQVAAIVSTLVMPLILYQLGDGMQVTFANALRGLGDVRMLMRYSFLAYLVISMPVSYVLGIVCHWGAVGIWMGFPCGLTTAAVLYFRRFLRVSGEKHKRTEYHKMGIVQKWKKL